jgi:hypothetical protein
VINLTEYVQVDKQLLRDILKEVGEVRRLLDRYGVGDGPTPQDNAEHK